MRLLLLLIFCFARVFESHGQALLPTSHGGPWQTIPANKEGWKSSGLGIDKGGNMGESQSDGSANFTTVGSYIEINFQDVAAQVSFWIKAEGARGFQGLKFGVFEKQIGGEYVSVGEKSFTVVSSTIGEKVSFNLQPTTSTVRLELLSVTGGTATVDDVKIIKAVPKINIKQGFTDILSNSNYAFGRYPVGSQSSAIEYVIENTGNANLLLTSTPLISITGSNPSDFIVDFSKTDAVVAPGSSTSFTITFKPLDAGSKSALITIANNDAEINPYTFTVTGVSVYCPEIESLDVYQGIVGSYVYIYGTNFEKATKVTFGGVEANFFVVDENTIDVQVPEGALSGPVEVYSEDCSAQSESFTVLNPTIKISKTEMEMNANVGSSEIQSYQVSAMYLDAAAGVLIDVSDLEGNFTISRTADGPFVKTISINENIVEEEVDGVIVNRTLAPVEIWVKFTPAVSGNSSTSISHQTANGETQILNINGIALTPICPEVTGLDLYEGKVGDYVYIHGTNLNLVNKVTFGGIEANFFVLDENTIDVQVPEGAISGPVTVFGVECSSPSEPFKVIGPIITISETEMGFTVIQGSSDMKLYQVSAVNLNDGASVIVDVNGLPGDYTISRTGEEGTFVKTITIIEEIVDNTLEATELWVRFTPSKTGASSAQITHSSEGATTEVLTVNGSTPVIPLPVELISFKAVKQNSAVFLTWATASELDNDYFDVEMTEDLKGKFKAVGRVHSSVNNSSIRQNYQFTHKGNFTGTRYYRLKQVDLDGTTDYSKVVAVSANGLHMAVEPRVYPNPINPDSKLVYTAEEAGKLNVTVVNMSGTRIQSKSYDVEAGENTITLNLNNNLPKGIYILMTEFNGKTEQVKLMKQ